MLTSRNLAEQVLNEGALYPELEKLYRELAPFVSDEEKVWRHFAWRFRPVIERHIPEFRRRYQAYYEMKEAPEVSDALIQGAYNYIARRFVEECRLNPQDFGLAAS